ncbi:MAG TPA: sigma-70 family RNA polymerase sigma factor [Candidatus Limnocylindria bacterium]|nr:sigma-70 family RNA polymerase sigma factor [Candidatus Limnocylindria bacterium]
MSGARAAVADDVLVREVATGSQDALAELYDRHASAVFAAACRLTTDRQMAEEVVQETFLAVWNRAELFNPATGSLAAWLHTIARNRTVDRLRAAARRPRLVSVSAVGPDDEPESVALERLAAGGETSGIAVVGGVDPRGAPESALAGAELREMLRQALDSMPDAERTVILLAYRLDLTQSEIADRLGWPLGTVKTRTRRALLRLREVLADSVDPELAPATLPVEVGE